MMTSAQLVETSVSDHYLQNCLNKILLLSPKTVFHSYALHFYSHVWCIIFFQLQDLAVTSGLRYPRLNFAESVIEGHIQDIKTTDRSYLRVVLWFSFLCPMFLGPFLYFWVKVHHSHRVAMETVVGWIIFVVETKNPWYVQ